MDGSTLGAAIALMKKNKPTDAQVESAVSDWLDDHPEATTTVQDGSITKAKLDSNLQGTVDDVSDLKNAVNDLDGGTTGQLLRKKSGTDYDFEWSSYASPTDAQVAEAIDDWLEDHPVSSVEVVRLI